MGIQSAVGGDDTVAVEVMVAGRIAAVVATIGKDFLTRGRILVAQALVYEVPDITTLIFGVFADEIPVLLEATHRVTHGVGILALDQRTGVVALGVFLTVVVVGIHRTVDIGLSILTGLLKLTGAGLVVRLHPVVGFLEVRTVASLISQRPHDDARMVLIGDHVTLLALDMCLGKGLVLGKGLLTIAHTMALDVGLCRQIDTIFVAEVVPTGIVGIVASTYGIDIELLHDLDILNHTLHRNDVAAIGIQFVTVGTLDEDGLTIDQQLTTLDLDMAEAHLLADNLQHFATLTELEFQYI